MEEIILFSRVRLLHNIFHIFVILITLPYVHTQHGHIGFCTLLIGKRLENYVILGGGAVDLWAPASCKLVVADFYSKFTVHAANRYSYVTQQFDNKHS